MVYILTEILCVSIWFFDDATPAKIEEKNSVYDINSLKRFIAQIGHIFI